MSWGSSWPGTARRAACWWSTGVDTTCAPAMAAIWGAQIPPATTTTSVSIAPRSVMTARIAPRSDSSMPVTRMPVMTCAPSVRAARASARAARRSLQLHQLLLARGEPQAPNRLEHAQRAVKLDAVAAEPHHRRRRVELRHQPGRMAGRAARQLALLDQVDVAQSGLREMVGDAAAGDAAADDDRAGLPDPIHSGSMPRHRARAADRRLPTGASRGR